MVLVGNKVDLAGRRQVSTEMGYAMASEYKAHFFETSAKTGVNVVAAFTQLAESADASLPPRKPGAGNVDLVGPPKAVSTCCA